MRYYELIYNSSQKNRAGSVGFGVRTATLGIPEAYIRVLEEQEIFAYATGNCKLITPKELLEKPERIREQPRGYFYAKLPITPQQTLYVLGRKISVGFDYTYYQNHQGGRLGNYVIHLYLFEEQPDVEAFQLLYEHPAAGSNRFRPLLPDPVPENEEMCALSLGASEPLEATNRSFRAQLLPDIQPEALALLFGYIAGKAQHKPVLVSLEEQCTARVLADFYRLLPAESVLPTFITNHQEEGVKRGYELTFLNEYYENEIYPSQVIYLDFVHQQLPDTPEQRTFAPMLQEQLKRGDLGEVHQLVGWLFSEEYDLVKGLSAQANRSFYCYLHRPEQFKLEELFNNSELQQLYQHYFQKKSPQAQLFMQRVNELFDKGLASADALAQVMMQVENLRQGGLSVEPVIRHRQEAVTKLVLTDSGTLARMIQQCTLRVLAPYFDRAQLAHQRMLLRDPLLKGSWMELYRYFYEKPQEKFRELVETSLACGLDAMSRNTLYVTVEPDERRRVNTYVELLKEDPSKLSIFWPLIQPLWANQGVDLIQSFDRYRQENQFAPLFLEQLRKESRQLKNGTELTFLKRCCDLMQGNAALRKELEKEFATRGDGEPIYGSVYQRIKQQLKEGHTKSKSECGEVITDCVLEPFRKEQHERALYQDWLTLSNYLSNVSERGELNLDKSYALAQELHDASYFKQMLTLKLNERHPLPADKVRELGGDLYRFYGCADFDAYQHELQKLTFGEDDKLKYSLYSVGMHVSKMPFKEVMSRMERFQITDAVRETLLTRYFEKEYASYQRAERRKAFWRHLFSFLHKEGKSTKKKS